jgi:hypothetical protein
MFHDINQGINKQVLGTEKVWSFFPAFSDKRYFKAQKAVAIAQRSLHIFGAIN